MDQGPPYVHPGGQVILMVLLVILPIAICAAYLRAAGRERASGAWSVWRVASFTTGTALLVAAMTPPVADWAHHDLRGHMLQHLLLGMFAPLGLVLGAPGTLLLRSVPVSAARRIVTVLDTPVVRFWVHPIIAFAFNIGGMYALYLTPLFALTLTNSAAHVFLHVHFVLSGYLFTWAIAGPDPAPHRPGMRMRLGVLFVAAAAHASLAKVMYGYGFPSGTTHEPHQVQAAAQWMYYGGDLAELLLIVAFFGAWFRSRELPDLLADSRLRN